MGLAPAFPRDNADRAPAEILRSDIRDDRVSALMSLRTMLLEGSQGRAPTAIASNRDAGRSSNVSPPSAGYRSAGSVNVASFVLCACPFVAKTTIATSGAVRIVEIAIASGNSR